VARDIGIEQLLVSNPQEVAVADLVPGSDARVAATTADQALVALVRGPVEPTTAEEIEVWDTEQRRLLARLTGHAGRVEVLAFSPGGTVLASGGRARLEGGLANGELRIWNLALHLP